MRKRLGSAVVVLGLTVVVLGVLGCAVTKPASDPWTTHYIGSPDDVWTAIHIALIDAGYDVESENRVDGLVRAVRDGEIEGSTEMLSIDQVMRTNDVNVYVRVAGGADEPTMTMDRKEAIAKEFLALLNGVLY